MSRRHRTLASGGGCVRKTVSLPAGLVKQAEDFVSLNAGLTFSAFVSDALEAHLALNPRGGKNQP